MSELTVRKNFALDAEAVKNAERVLKQNHKKSRTIHLYFKALAKDTSFLKQVEKIAAKRTGGFIGLLDDQIGHVDFKKMKASHNKSFS